MILTTTEAAAYLGISPAGVRKLVERDRLAPVRGAARPLRFRWADVEALRASRAPAAEHARLDDLARRWRSAS